MELDAQGADHARKRRRLILQGGHNRVVTAEEAYRCFGLPHARGNTWLAMWRDLVRRYPDRDARALLQDLIALHGRKGK